MFLDGRRSTSLPSSCPPSSPVAIPTPMHWVSYVHPLVDRAFQSPLQTVFSESLTLSSSAYVVLGIESPSFSFLLGGDFHIFLSREEGGEVLEKISDSQLTPTNNGYYGLIGPLSPGSYQIAGRILSCMSSESDICPALQGRCLPFKLVTAPVFSPTVAAFCRLNHPPLPEKIQVSPEGLSIYQSFSLAHPTDFSRNIESSSSSHQLSASISIEAPQGFSIIAEGDKGISFEMNGIQSQSGEVFFGRVGSSLKVTISTSELVSKVDGASAHCLSFQLRLVFYSSSSKQSPSLRQMASSSPNLFLDPQPLTQDSHFQFSKFYGWICPEKLPFTWTISASKVFSLKFQVSFLSVAQLPLALSLSHSAAHWEATEGKWEFDRLLLKETDLTPGKYLLELRNKALTKRDLPCALVGIVGGSLETDDEQANVYRAELLEYPELLPVQPLLPSLNVPGLLTSVAQRDITFSQIFDFYEFQEWSSIQLVLSEKSLLRVYCEPLDLAHPEASLRLDKSGQLLTSSRDCHILKMLEAGSYELKFKSARPQLVTFGIGAFGQFLHSQPLYRYNKECEKQTSFDFIPDKTDEAGEKAQTSFVSSESLTGNLKLDKPSLVHFEVGGSFVWEAVRISIQVAEGSWIGEQRSLRNSVVLDLLPGAYHLKLSSNAFSESSGPSMCIPIFSHIIVSPSDSKSSETSRQRESCDFVGTLPLPLDFSGQPSAALGGPISSRNRLLVRTQILISELHDSRKRVFLVLPDYETSLIKIGVSGATVENLKFSLNPHELTGMPKADWRHADSWEKIYKLERDKIVTHRNRYSLEFHFSEGETIPDCCKFSLFLQVAPLSDVTSMTACVAASQANLLPPRLLSPLSWDSPAVSVKETEEGFLWLSEFELTSLYFVEVTVGFNFLNSHIEIDVVQRENEKSRIAVGQLQAFQGPIDSINVRQWIGQVFPPGKYYLRVADDHWTTQFQSAGQTMCFPLSIEIRSRKIGTSQELLSFLPDLTVPVNVFTEFVVSLIFMNPVTEADFALLVLNGKTKPKSINSGDGSLGMIWIIAFEISKEMQFSELILTSIPQRGTLKWKVMGSPAPEPWHDGTSRGASEDSLLPGVIRRVGVWTGDREKGEVLRGDSGGVSMIDEDANSEEENKNSRQDGPVELIDESEDSFFRAQSLPEQPSVEVKKRKHEVAAENLPAQWESWVVFAWSIFGVTFLLLLLLYGISRSSSLSTKIFSSVFPGNSRQKSANRRGEAAEWEQDIDRLAEECADEDSPRKTFLDYNEDYL